MTSLPLEGRVAVVTGASGGIGGETALALAEQGATVVGLARRDHPIDPGGRVQMIACDLTDAVRCDAVVADILARHGRVDVLVNNAGVMELAPVEEADLDGWRDMVELNLLAAARICRTALPGLQSAAESRGVADLVIVGSASGRRPIAGRAMYAATKAGLSAFAEAFAREVAVHGIRVLIVEPGLTDTGLRAARVQRESAAARAQAGPAQAMDPATVAAAIAFAVTRPVGVAVTALAIEPLDRPP